MLAGQFLALLDDPFEVAVGDGRSWTMPCLPVNRILSLPPMRLRWRLRSVVAPKLLFSRAYSSLPTRICSRSSRRTTAARTVSRSSLRFLRSRSTRARSRGRASPNSGSPHIWRRRAWPVVGMVAILLAAAGIAARRLEVAVGVLAEPGVDIGRGQRDGVQPVDLVAVGDPLAIVRRNRPRSALSFDGCNPARRRSYDAASFWQSPSLVEA